jgi:hypothetical protein
MTSSDIKDTILFAATLAGAVALIVTGHWGFGLMLLLIL